MLPEARSHRWFEAAQPGEGRRASWRRVSIPGGMSLSSKDRIALDEAGLADDGFREPLIGVPAAAGAVEPHRKIAESEGRNPLLNHAEKARAMFESGTLVVTGHTAFFLDRRNRFLDFQRLKQHRPLLPGDGRHDQSFAVGRLVVAPERDAEIIAHARPIVTAHVDFRDLPHMSQRSGRNIAQGYADLVPLAGH